jgi:hypothetical protein
VLACWKTILSASRLSRTTAGPTILQRPESAEPRTSVSGAWDFCHKLFAVRQRAIIDLSAQRKTIRAVLELE